MKRRVALLEVFRHRESRLLLSGQAVSNFGDGIANVALILVVLDTSHGASRLTLFAAARMIPMIAFLLVGGAIVDRVSRRLLLLVSDLSRAVLTGALVLALATHTLRYDELLAFAFLFGCFDAVFTPALTAITPEIVTEDLLGAMNAVRPLSNNFVGNMLGPAVGGLLAAWSSSWALGVDALTFVVSAGTLLLMRSTRAPHHDERSSVFQDIRAGLRYVRHTPWIWATLVGVSLPNALIFTPMGVLLSFYVLHGLHSSKETVGYLFATFGLAGALGAIYAGSVTTPRRRIRVMWSLWTAGSLAATFLGVAHHVWEVFLVPVAVSPTMYIGNVIWESMLQSEVPRELLGRVSSVDWFVSLGLSPVGLLVAGVVSDHVGIPAYFVISGLACSLPGLAILASRRVNAVDQGRSLVER